MGKCLQRSGAGGQVPSDHHAPLWQLWNQVGDVPDRHVSERQVPLPVLRCELLEELGIQGGRNLAGEVEGVAMSQYLPRGLAGVPAGMAGMAAALQYINPKFIPLIAASSPRVAGEFLRMVGKASSTVPGASESIGKAAAYLTVPPSANLLGRDNR